MWCVCCVKVFVLFFLCIPSCFVVVFKALRITATSLISVWRTRQGSFCGRTRPSSLSRPTRGNPCVWVRWSTVSCSLVQTLAPYQSASTRLKWVELCYQATPCWGSMLYFPDCWSMLPSKRQVYKCSQVCLLFCALPIILYCHDIHVLYSWKIFA